MRNNQLDSYFKGYLLIQFSKNYNIFGKFINMNKLMLLGGGSNSQVYSYGQGQEQVVLKVVASSNLKEQKHLKNQFELLQSLHHKNVVKSLRYRQKVDFPGNKTDKQLQKSHTNNILVLEYASKGSLFNYLRNYNPEISAKRYAFKSVVQGLSYLHSEGIAHRDLKLQNILVFVQDGNQEFKISDFGFASRFQQKGQTLKFKDYKGTRKGYMAPEIHQCAKNGDNEYDAVKADIFALGVILFCLVFEHFPFEYGVSSNVYYKHISQKQFKTFWSCHNVEKFQLQKGYRVEEVKDLFERMVCFDPESRLSAKQILRHGWLSE